MTHLEKASEHYIETERLTRQKAHRERGTRPSKSFIVILIDWLINRTIDWLINRFIDWLIAVAYGEKGWLIDWLINRIIDWMINQSIDWLTDWLIGWLIDWLINWLIDWLIGWLIDWLIGNCFCMWWKRTPKSIELKRIFCGRVEVFIYQCWKI